jgi:hypothetical protein
VELDDAPLPARQRPQSGLDQHALLTQLEPALGAGVAPRRAVGVKGDSANDDVPAAVPAGHPERLRAVAEVAADLAHDRRNGIRGQRGAATGVVTVDRLDQTDRTDLGQILELLAAGCKSAGERSDEWEMKLDQPLASVAVTILTPGPQKFV